MDAKVFHRSRLQLIYGFVVCLALAAFFYWSLSTFSSPARRGDLQLLIIGWILFPVFAAMAALLAPFAFLRRIDLVIDNEGFQDHMSLYPKVLWSDVSDVDVKASANSFQIKLTLKNTNLRNRYIPRWIRALPTNHNRTSNPVLTFQTKDDAALIVYAIQGARAASERGMCIASTNE